jgi:hypothetical protein
MGNVTIIGAGGFMIYTDCEFGANVTIPNTFAGVVYFVRCSFGNASGVYTFSNNSAQQVIISDSTGLPNTQPAKVSYYGNIVSKNFVQKFYINNVAINPVGATEGQVLRLVSGAWVPATLPVPEVTQAELDAAVASLQGADASLQANIDALGTSTGTAIGSAVGALRLPVGRRDGSTVLVALTNV